MSTKTGIATPVHKISKQSLKNVCFGLYFYLFLIIMLNRTRDLIRILFGANAHGPLARKGKDKSHEIDPTVRSNDSAVLVTIKEG